MASELVTVAPGLKAWAAPKNAEEISRPIQVPPTNCTIRKRKPRINVSSTVAARRAFQGAGTEPRGGSSCLQMINTKEPEKANHRRKQGDPQREASKEFLQRDQAGQLGRAAALDKAVADEIGAKY